MKVPKKLVNWLIANYQEDVSIGMSSMQDVAEEGAYLFISDDYLVIIYNDKAAGTAVSLTITEDSWFVTKADFNTESGEKYEYDNIKDSIKMFNKLADQNLPY